MSLLDDLKNLEKKITKGPWNKASDGTIIQTAHITRDVWYIPRIEADLDFITYVRNNLPEIIKALEEKK